MSTNNGITEKNLQNEPSSIATEARDKSAGEAVGATQGQSSGGDGAEKRKHNFQGLPEEEKPQRESVTSVLRHEF